MTPSTQLTPQNLSIHPLRPDEFDAAEAPATPWLWHGYLAPGKVIAFISPPKTGKTTLATLLLARAALGGPLAGLAVAPTRALVVSEESTADWSARCRRVALGRHVQFVCRPFPGARPTDAQWFALIASLEALHRRDPFGLIVIDALATLLPGYAETSAPRLLDCLLPLQTLAQQGTAVWLLHHPAKRGHVDGQAARGSGALSGFADIVMEMSCYRRARSSDRRRRLCAYSRYVETPRHLLLELTPDANDYVVTHNPAVPRLETWPQVHDILAHTFDKLTQDAILQRWEDDARPNRTTLSRWLNRAAAHDLIRRSGSGLRGDRYLYWLADNEPHIYPGPDAPAEASTSWRSRMDARAEQSRLATLRSNPAPTPPPL